MLLVVSMGWKPKQYKWDSLQGRSVRIDKHRKALDRGLLGRLQARCILAFHDRAVIMGERRNGCANDVALVVDMSYVQLPFKLDFLRQG